MASILIIEDRIDLARLLKKEIEGGGHRVAINTGFGEQKGRFDTSAADLVLINYGCMEKSGWEIFNRIKEQDETQPVLLYALDTWRPAQVGFISRAVKEALNCAGKSYINSRENQKSMCF